MAGTPLLVQLAGSMGCTNISPSLYFYFLKLSGNYGVLSGIQVSTLGTCFISDFANVLKNHITHWEGERKF